MIENILVHHDVVNIDTKNEKIKQYAKEYIQYLNRNIHSKNPIILKINGEEDNRINFDEGYTSEESFSDDESPSALQRIMKIKSQFDASGKPDLTWEKAYHERIDKANVRDEDLSDDENPSGGGGGLRRH